MSSDTPTVITLGYASTRRPDGFWRRQFSQTPTGPQIVAEVVFGILLPLLCLAWDPFVLNLAGELGRFRPGALWVLGFEMLTLAAALVLGWRVRALCGPLVGVLLVGGLIALVTGLCLLPLSLIGLLFAGIGALGLVPFLTAFVFVRRAVVGLRRMRAAGARSREQLVGVAIGIALIAAVAFATLVVIPKHVDRQIARVCSASTETDFALASLGFWHAFGYGDQLVYAYADERDPQIRTRLATAYQQIDGGDIAARPTALFSMGDTLHASHFGGTD